MRPVLDPVIPEFVKKYQIVDGFHEIEEIMKSPDFTQGGQPERETFLRGTLIYLEGNEHRDTKNLLSPLMSRDSLAYYELHLLDPVITETLANLRHERDEDGLVRTDLVPLLRIMLRQISARVTGADGVDTPERIERFGALASKVGAVSSGQFATDRPQVIAAGKEALLMLIDEFLQASLDRRKQLVDELNAARRSRCGDPVRLETVHPISKRLDADYDTHASACVCTPRRMDCRTPRRQTQASGKRVSPQGRR